MASRRYAVNRSALGRTAFDAGNPTTFRFPHGTMLTVTCPDCAAQVKEQCVSPTGKLKAAVHISRRRIAIRKYWADNSSEETTL